MWTCKCFALEYNIVRLVADRYLLLSVIVNFSAMTSCVVNSRKGHHLLRVT